MTLMIRNALMFITRAQTYEKFTSTSVQCASKMENREEMTDLFQEGLFGWLDFSMVLAQGALAHGPSPLGPGYCKACSKHRIEGFLRKLGQFQSTVIRSRGI